MLRPALHLLIRHRSSVLRLQNQCWNNSMLAGFLLLVANISTIARAQDAQSFPKPDSIKGLQVQMVDDAIKLGVRHGAINFALNGMFASENQQCPRAILKSIRLSYTPQHSMIEVTPWQLAMCKLKRGELG